MAKAAKKSAPAKKSKAAPVVERLVASVSDEVLADTPARAAKFLQGVAGRPRIMSALAQSGYSTREHDEGWALLRAVLKLAPSTVKAAARTPQAAALAEIDAWDEPNLPIFRTMFTGEMSAIGAFLLDGIEPQQGAQAAVGVGRLLSRIDDLEAGRAKGIDAKQAKDALKKIERRGYGKAERARLAALVTLATSTPDVAPPTDTRGDDERYNDLVRLRAWYEEVTSIARRQIKRRDDLIALGLAERKRAKKPEEPKPTT